MNQQLRAFLDSQAKGVDDDLKEAIQACGGDVGSALRAALISNALLMEENGRLKKQVSRGFARVVRRET